MGAAVPGYEQQLTLSLHERGQLAYDDEVLAAWSGTLLELRGWSDVEPDPSDLPVAIFGVTRRGGHILSRLGLFSFPLSDLRSPYSPHFGILRFSVERHERPPVEVLITLDGALAIAEKLREAISDRTTVGNLAVATRRPPAKRRADEAQASSFRVGRPALLNHSAPPASAPSVHGAAEARVGFCTPNLLDQSIDPVEIWPNPYFDQATP